MQKQTTNLTYAAFFTALTAIGAFIKIPFILAPFTLQTLFTVMAAVLLPTRWAVLSQVTYLVLGLAGLPIFAQGGGIGYVLQPTFGYLVALPFTAFIISRMMPVQGSFTACFVVLIGQIILLLIGSMWMAGNLVLIQGKNIEFTKIIFYGAIVFIPSMLLKALVTVFVYKRFKNILNTG